MLPSVSYISASLPSHIKASLNLFENKTPTTDQPEQTFEYSSIISFSPILFVSLLDVWECVCAL